MTVILGAAQDEHARLVEEGLLGEAQIGLLHGRMSAEEKGSALAAFSSGRTPALIATTVVEVPRHTLPVGFRGGAEAESL